MSSVSDRNKEIISAISNVCIANDFCRQSICHSVASHTGSTDSNSFGYYVIVKGTGRKRNDIAVHSCSVGIDKSVVSVIHAYAVAVLEGGELLLRLRGGEPEEGKEG